LTVLERRRDTAGEAAEATAAEMECGVILERQLANDDGTSRDDDERRTPNATGDGPPGRHRKTS
jgi:hypothetical protein